jgi:pyruvate/2-oxoglutarate dehydrogenase complex dihydrolipoamide acyltransferase (E2) component
MKILRIRRGYTTNSSAYTEWLPPPPGTAASGQTGQGGATGTTTGAAPAGPAPASAGTPAAASPTVPAPGAQSVGAQSASPLAGNALIVAGLVAAVVAVFGIERLLRRLRRNSAGEPDE